MREQIRPLELNDLDQYATLVRTCFGGPSTAEMVRDLVGDPYLDLPCSLGLFLDGRLVSAIRFPRRQMWLGRVTLTVGAVTAVCTDPAWRRRGYAYTLLRHALPLMAELEVPTAMLFGFRFDFYRRLGWELAADVWTAILATVELSQGTVSAVPVNRDERYVRPFTPADLLQVATLYAATTRGAPGSFARSSTWWEHWLQRRRHACVVWDDGQIGGYAVYRVVDRFQLPSPLDVPPWQRDQTPVRQVEILELAVARPAVARGILSTLHQLVDRTGRLTFPAVRLTDLTRLGILRAGTTLYGGPGFMFRVVDLVPALQARDLPALAGEALAIVVDDPLVQTATMATIAFTPDAQQVTAGVEAADQIVCDARAFAQLFIGYRSADELAGEGRLRASTARAIEKAAYLFPRTDPFLPALDVF